jgi:hypothetical protein
MIPADLVQKRLGHLAPGAVLNADKKNFNSFHGHLPFTESQGNLTLMN